MSIKSWRTGCGLLAMALAASACTTTGAGTGTTRDDNRPVSFEWKSDNAVSGTMTASLGNGESFSGKFFQITSDTRIDRVRSLWAGWGYSHGPYWGEWPYWSYDAGPDFVKHYSGRVVANLQGTDGEHMRCSFRLVEPSSGMSGGGAGRCQIPDGETVDATFPAA